MTSQNRDVKGIVADLARVNQETWINEQPGLHRRSFLVGEGVRDPHR